MANQYVGVGILFGVGDITATLTGFTDLSNLQSADISGEADQETVKNSSGVTKAVATFDERKRMTLEMVPTSGTNVGTLNAATVPALGSNVTITSAISPAGDTFIVESWNLSRSNNRAALFRINLINYVEGALPS